MKKNIDIFDSHRCENDKTLDKFFFFSRSRQNCFIFVCILNESNQFDKNQFPNWLTRPATKNTEKKKTKIDSMIFNVCFILGLFHFSFSHFHSLISSKVYKSPIISIDRRVPRVHKNRLKRESWNIQKSNEPWFCILFDFFFLTHF